MKPQPIPHPRLAQAYSSIPLLQVAAGDAAAQRAPVTQAGYRYLCRHLGSSHTQRTFLVGVRVVKGRRLQRLDDLRPLIGPGNRRLRLGGLLAQLGADLGRQLLGIRQQGILLRLLDLRASCGGKQR